MICTKLMARSRTYGSSAMWSNTVRPDWPAPWRAGPRPALSTSAWRTTCGTWVKLTGAHMVRHHRVDRHHHAHEGDDQHVPDRHAQATHRPGLGPRHGPPWPHRPRPCRRRPIARPESARPVATGRATRLPRRWREAGWWKRFWRGLIKVTARCAFWTWSGGRILG